MKRREFIIAGRLRGNVRRLRHTQWSLTARAQPTQRVRRIGVLMGLAADDPESQARLAAFAQGLQQAGWTVGQNIRIDYRWGAGNRRHHAQTRGGIGRAGRPTSSSPIPARRSRRCCKRAAPFRSYLRWSRIRSAPATSATWRAQAATSPASPTSNIRSAANGLNCSRRSRLDVTRAAVLRESFVASGPGQFGAIQAASQTLGMELRPIDLRDAGEIERDIAAFAQQDRERRPDRDRKPGGDRPPRSDQRAGASPPAACCLQLSLLRRRAAA